VARRATFHASARWRVLVERREEVVVEVEEVDLEEACATIVTNQVTCLATVPKSAATPARLVRAVVHVAAHALLAAKRVICLVTVPRRAKVHHVGATTASVTTVERVVICLVTAQMDSVAAVEPVRSVILVGVLITFSATVPRKLAAIEETRQTFAATTAMKWGICQRTALLRLEHSEHHCRLEEHVTILPVLFQCIDKIFDVFPIRIDITISCIL